MSQVAENRDGRISVFLTGLNMHPTATGEEFLAWKWAQALSEVTRLTVFSFQREGREPLRDTLPHAEVVTTPMPRAFSRFPRFSAMAKPHYPAFLNAARKAYRRSGNIDIAHQFMPVAPRYPSPLRGLGVPYVIGPVGGSLETPPAFQYEGRSAAWFTRFRALDALRFRYDPWLRRSFSEAKLVLGVAPYVEEVLSDIPLQRFEAVSELGVDDVPTVPDRAVRESRHIKLLHVGRGVRTKGLRDVIRAMAHLKEDFPHLQLTSAGAGEEIEICRREAAVLGIGDRVRFLELRPRHEIEKLYESADLFVFPSFREPSGSVLYEAMSWGLPVITAARGGPGWVVDDDTGIRVPVTDPERYALDIAGAIRRLVSDAGLRHEMGLAGQAKIRRIGLWSVKARKLLSMYQEVLSGHC